MAQGRWQKTDSGRAEIRQRTLALTRTARNLLLILDASKPADDWIALVNGATPTDFAGLADHGLVEPAGGTAAAPAPVAPPVAAPDTFDELRSALMALDHESLYNLLTAQVRQQMGLIKGYRTVLEVERCAGLPELQALALRLATQWRDDVRLDSLRRALQDRG